MTGGDLSLEGEAPKRLVGFPAREPRDGLYPEATIAESVTAGVVVG